MTSDERARRMAGLAAALAAGAAVELPDSLLLWQLAGQRPHPPASRSADPAGELGTSLEAMLSDGERRRGAHYTPSAVADRLAAMALDGLDASEHPTVVDPSCGGGALLLAAGRCLASAGVPREVAANQLLWGADVDPVAVAVTETAIALWSGGVAPRSGHLVTGDTLAAGSGAWPSTPAGGFRVLVGNPPFQGQMGRGTVRSPEQAAAVRERFGDAVPPYVDTAALFLLAGIALVADGGRLAMVLPQSVLAARDAGPVREAIAARATLERLWAPRGKPFGARVDVCVPVFEVDGGDGRPNWSERLADASGVPDVPLGGAGVLRDRADAVASFRDEYYALAAHVREAGTVSAAPLVTSGLIDVGCAAWGIRPVRFAKRWWQRPEIDLAAMRADGSRARTWLDRVLQPKVVVASQTRILEAAPDPSGRWVPSTPAVSVVPHVPSDVARLAAVLCAPPVSAWAVRRAAGTALSPHAIRVSASLLLDVPLPPDERAWTRAAQLLAAQDLDGFGRVATEMYRLPAGSAAVVQAWWSATRRPGRR